jgi:hypothetical protein
MSRSAISQISALGKSIKMRCLLEQKFNGDAEAIGKAIEAATLRAKERASVSDALINGGVVAQLEGFRKAVGEEMWTTIASNPNLSDLLRQWMREQGQKVALALVEEIKSLLPEDHGMSDQDIFEAIGQMGD